MKFVKMHGIGNDYVLIDHLRASSNGKDLAALARAICDRHYGVGSDGMLIVEPSSKADFRFRMFNPDGSESEMCGNGIRCFGKHVYDSRLTTKQEFRVETGNGILNLLVHARDGAAERLTVSMGVPEFRPARIPVAVEGERAFDITVEDQVVSCVSMGNPHAVSFLSGPVADFPLETIGPRVEHNALFPRRINLEVVRQRGPAELDVRVWERGAGPTLACGTGACAVMAVAREKGLVGDRATINLPGGPLELAWDGRGEVLMTGAAATVFEGDWPS